MTGNSTVDEERIEAIAVSGRLDTLRAQQLRRELEAMLARCSFRIVVDLSETSFVDSAGLAALAKGMKDCRAHGGDLRIVSPRSRDANRVFRLTRFDQVFYMGATVDEVIATW